MFFHLFKYRMKQILHTKESIFWVFIFPICLGTLFFLAFGNMLDNSDELIKTIPVAVVEQKNADPAFYPVTKNITMENDKKLFKLSIVSDKKAKQLLSKEKVSGIFYIGAEPTLTVAENGLNSSIINSYLSEYLQRSLYIKTVVKNNPQKLQEAEMQISKQVSYIKNKSLNNSHTSSLIQYFYALIAMVCLYGSTLGLDTIMNIQPHLSDRGARKSVAPVHKLKVIFADTAATIAVNYLSVLLLFVYITVILRVDMGNRIPQSLIACFAGSVIGVCMGVFVGSIGKLRKTTKEGLCMGVSMLCVFLGGLMVNTMPNIIAHHAPIINKINPSVLITDCFYSLSVYPGYHRYLVNLASLLAISVVLCIGSYLFIRKGTK